MYFYPDSWCEFKVTYEDDVLTADPKTEITELKTIDELLDEYNDYMALYQMFGDQEYKDKANEVMEIIKAR